MMCCKIRPHFIIIFTGQAKLFDISHPDYKDQIHVVYDTLKEIGAHDKPLIKVFNKIDLLTEPVHHNPGPFAPEAAGMNGETAVFISAAEKTNIDILREKLYAHIKAIHITRYPYHDFLYNIDSRMEI